MKEKVGNHYSMWNINGLYMFIFLSENKILYYNEINGEIDKIYNCWCGIDNYEEEKGFKKGLKKYLYTDGRAIKIVNVE